MPSHAKINTKPKRRWPKVLGAIVLALFTISLALCVAIVVVRPTPAILFLEEKGITVPSLFPEASQSGEKAGSSSSQVNEDNSSNNESNSISSHEKDFTNFADKSLSSEEAADQAQQEKRTGKTPLIARCQGVDIRLVVPMADLTGVLFHQASYDYALSLETEVPAADYETIADTRNFFINHDQVPGDDDWAETEVLYIWRTTDTTDVDTSMDVGAPAGTGVKAPVDGTVVLVRDYKLYEEMDDVEIHIQPTGRPDLDCVLIHLKDPCVKAGDKVEAGITNIAVSRDIEEFLTDVQLGFFTPEGVGGNHVHVQMNNADAAGYREKKLEGAIKPPTT